MKKAINEFKEVLAEEKANQEVYADDCGEGYDIHQGWIEALEYVIRILENPLYKEMSK